MEDLKRQLQEYIPVNEQERNDRDLMLKWLGTGMDIYTRENQTAHLTASAWVTIPDHSKVLMAYHNIYHSWAWLGGHADGCRDLAQVALKEVREESGLSHIHLVNPNPISLEILTVDGHEKRGSYVSSHLHLNVTYLIEADPEDTIRIKPDENSKIAWFTPEEALRRSTEDWFIERIYPKLNQKLELF